MNQTETLKEQVKSYWDAHPCGTQFTDLAWGSKEFFDAVENFRYHIQPFMHELAGFDRYRGKRVLEVGCGLGTDLVQFARGGAIVTGIDLSSTSIELVKKRFALYGLSVDARTADAEHLPFDENSFDLVYSFGVLHHTPNTQKALDEVYRVLKPGGECTIMLYHKHSLHVWLGVAWHWLRGTPRRVNSLLEDWVRVYDGVENPLGKAYSRAEARRMFSAFSDLTIVVCDPIRRRLPSFANAVNQSLFARWFGFWMVVQGRKPLADR
jgi:ubiquinone/menaquinone biosynthesis C-methylase UbiE